MADRSISFDVSAIDKASKALEDVGREVTQLGEKIDRASGTIEVDADTAKAQEQLRAVDAQLARLNAKSFKVDADTAKAERDLKVLEAELTKATGDRKVKVEADIATAQARLRALAAEKVSIDVDTGAAGAKLAALRAELAGISDRRSKVDLDTGAAFSQAARLATQLRALATPITITVGIAGAGAVASWIASVSAGLTSIGAIGVTSAGVAKAAFSGIGDALSAMGEKATSGGGAVAASASSIRSATRQVEAAQRDLAAANEQVKLSEQDLSQAQEDARRAVAALDDARKEATRTLEDYKTRTESMSLSLESANLSIAEAQERLNKVNADSKSTALERARAELSVREAIQRRNEIEIDAKRLTEDKTEADRKGVEQSDQVVTAQDKIKEANKRVEDAQRALAKSHDDVTLAVQRLSDSQLALQEAMKPQGGGGGTTVDKLREAMANLTPEGQRFVIFLRGLIDGPLKELQDTAQSKFLPGLQDGIAGFMANLTNAKQSIATVATNLGNFFREIGPHVGLAADALLRLAAIGSGPGLSSLADVVNRLLDQFTRWANSQDANDIIADFKEIGDKVVAMKDIVVGAFNLIMGVSQRLREEVQPIVDLYNAVKGLWERLTGASTGADQFGTAAGGAEGPTRNLERASKDLSIGLADVAAKAQAAKDQFLTSEQANLSYEQSLLRANEAIKTNGATLAENTEKGTANKAALLGLVEAANRNIKAMQDSGAPIDTVNGKYESQKQALIRTATQMGLSETAAQAYITKLLQTPAERNTKVNADTATAQQNIRNTQTDLANTRDKTVTVKAETSGAVGALRTVWSWLNSLYDKTVNVVLNKIGFSTGGWVPGAPSSVDSVSTNLAPGEFVVRSSAAQRWGPLLEAINAGASPSLVSNGGPLAALPAQRGVGGVGVGSIVNVYVSNAVVGNNDELSRVVITAIREAKARGLLVGVAV